MSTPILATPAPRAAGNTGAWVAAAIVIAISLLSTFTISTDDGQNVAAAGGAGGYDDGYYADDGTGTGTDVAGASAGSAGSAGGRRLVRGGDGSAGGAAGTDAAAAGGPGGPAAAAGGPAAAAGPDAGGPGGESAQCAKGQNAGSSDTGVSGGEIQFAATVVRTGIAVDFLGEASVGIDAALQKANRKPICGRLIKVKYDDDGWDPDKGARIIEKYIAEKKYFGLLVNPSSEGLRGPIRSGLIDSNKFPVIGADGMLIGQYRHDWVWPVATSTHSVSHIMCQDAIARGAKTFAIVYENNYRFGVEGESAFSGCVKRNAGDKALVKKLEVTGGKTSYRTEANEFITACSHSGSNLTKCDFIYVLLEPATAAQWVSDGGMGDGNYRPAKGFGAAQPLFVTAFAKDCGVFCANLRVWTSFKPPLDPYDKDPAVVSYVNELDGAGGADESNPHVQGAFQGGLLLIDALERLGAAPTREGMRQVLDSTCLDTGLAPKACFKPGNHFAAITAQAYEAVVSGNTFTGWRYTGSGFKTDTEVAKDQLKEE